MTFSPARVSHGDAFARTLRADRAFVSQDLRSLGVQRLSLYGAAGLSAGDEMRFGPANHHRDTREARLRASQRSELIDDVGLIVLDEGHMIGPSEREIRYETLVQRLLRRDDADDRRIVCLSAILPSGDELDDLTAWIRSDQPGEPVLSDWRPTRQRFGMLAWRGREARLTLDLTPNGPFIDKFVVLKPARGREKQPYPREASHLALFAAWEFAGQGKRTRSSRRRRTGWRVMAGALSICAAGAYLDLLIASTTRLRSRGRLKWGKNGSAKPIPRSPV